MEVFAKTSQSVSKQCLIKVHQYVTRTMSDENSNVADEDVELRVINHLTGEETRLEVLNTTSSINEAIKLYAQKHFRVVFDRERRVINCFPVSFALIDCEIQMIYLRLGICLATQRREVSFLQNSNSRNRRGV